MAHECSTFYRRLADVISIKQNKPYSLVVRHGDLCSNLWCVISLISFKTNVFHYVRE